MADVIDLFKTQAGKFARSANLPNPFDSSGPVDEIIIESAYGPRIVLRPGGGGGGGGLAQRGLAILQPKVTVVLKGGRAIEYAPLGNPPPTKWPILRFGALAVGGLALLGFISLFRR